MDLIKLSDQQNNFDLVQKIETRIQRDFSRIGQMNMMVPPVTEGPFPAYDFIIPFNNTQYRFELKSKSGETMRIDIEKYGNDHGILQSLADFFLFLINSSGYFKLRMVSTRSILRFYKDRKHLDGFIHTDGIYKWFYLPLDFYNDLIGYYDNHNGFIDMDSFCPRTGTGTIRRLHEIFKEEVLYEVE